MARILVVDDEEKMRKLLCIMLSRRGHDTAEAGHGRQALQMLEEQRFDLIISDIRMPVMDGMEMLRAMKDRDISVPVIFITAFATVESAVEAMRAGALDYITKPFDEARIHLTVERTLNAAKIMAENRRLREELKAATGQDEIVYVSRAMAQVMELARQVADQDSVVLLTGESGTGKELLARFIHNASQRSSGRFVPVNCAAISASLVESELFGHEKGAFTGADRRRSGKFEYAAGGTLFMDEIGDLPLEAQAKLLRVLQDKRIQRVGGNEEIYVDVRVICATNRDLEEMVEKGEFRKDLFFRINVFPIHLPPLRERKEDIEPLANYFLKRFGRGAELEITPAAVRLLASYPWPGNVRELSNAIERAAILGMKEGRITERTFSFLTLPDTGPAGTRKGADAFELPADGIDLEALERSLARQALERSGNNQSAAARLLGLSRSKFRTLLKGLKDA